MATPGEEGCAACVSHEPAPTLASSARPASDAGLSRSTGHMRTRAEAPAVVHQYDRFPALRLNIQDGVVADVLINQSKHPLAERFLRD